MAEKIICSKPDCDGEIVNGVCPECEKKKQTAAEGGHGSVGFGMSDIQRRTPFKQNSGGGFCNG